jgi:hypothetical protein
MFTFLKELVFPTPSVPKLLRSALEDSQRELLLLDIQQQHMLAEAENYSAARLKHENRVKRLTDSLKRLENQALTRTGPDD